MATAVRIVAITIFSHSTLARLLSAGARLESDHGA
jgi:hypothetical protein